MRVAIIGGGISGRAIERALTARGVAAELFPRSNGFDVLRPVAARSLGAADVVVEVTGILSTRKRVTTDFFTRSTRAVGEAARAAVFVR